jgi:predicted amidophosphoribosyltransferase
VATVAELSAPYTNFMLNPLTPAAPDVCEICTTFTEGWRTCHPCGRQTRFTDGVLPISYSVALGQLHHALQTYKRGYPAVASQFQLQLAAVLWRFVAQHEACLARAVGVDRFDVVSTVPSSSQQRDEIHPLRRIVGEIVAPTRDRHRRLLVRSGTPVAERAIDPGKYNATEDLHGEAVLLIDDTWTTGANSQSAAGGLKTAGAGAVAVLVIGRHVNPDYKANRDRIAALPRPFDWERCALHTP